MTDDDRMDRAQRIREMREGDRPDDVQTDDEPDGSDPGRGQATDDTPLESDAGASADDGGASQESAGDSAGASGDPPVEDASDLPGVELNQSLGGSDTTGGDDRAVEAEGQAGAGAGAPTAGAGAGAGTPAENAGNGLASAGDSGDGAAGVPASEVTDVDVDVEQLAQQAGVSPSGGSTEDRSPADEPAGGPAGMASARGAAAAVETTAETRVLEFELGTERYCLDIEHVEEIVKRETVTRVPNTPEYVEGVVDLRGQITTILDPKVLLDIDSEGSKELIVVFDPDEFEDQGAIGWVVDDVTQVTPVREEEVNDSPVDADHINGVVERDDQFVIWTQPAVAIESAAG